jgi:hypothetical protein
LQIRACHTIHGIPIGGRCPSTISLGLTAILSHHR